MSRLLAVKQIYDEQGLTGILALAEQSHLTGSVAEAVTEILDDPIQLATLIDSGLLKGGDFYSFVSILSEAARKRLVILNTDSHPFFAERVRLARLNNAQIEAISMLTMAWPRERQTWEASANLGADIEQEYWQRMHVPLNVSPADRDYVIDHMIAANRASELIDASAYAGLTLSGTDVLKVLSAFLTQVQDRTDMPNRCHGLPEFLKKSAQRNDVDAEELIKHELALLPLLSAVHGLRLKIYQRLASNPDFFAECIALIYRKKSEVNSPPELDENLKRRALQAFELLLSWKYVLQGSGPPAAKENPGPLPFPGWSDGDQIDQSKLLKWIARIRELTKAQDRIDVGDLQLGNILAYAPNDPNDHLWPHRSVREAIEAHWSSRISDGIVNEQFSKRGVFTKAMYEGGLQELSLSGAADNWAAAVRTNWPKTATILSRIRDMWKAEAERADEDVAVRKLGDL